MIRYALICQNDHDFEGWFSNSSDYDDQCASGLLQCPVCATQVVEKAIMAPAVRTSRKAEARTETSKATMNAVAAKIRDEIAANCEDVGESFAEEARAIHYGEKPERGIYGAATPRESAELAEEGIAAHPLPDILVPPTKKDKAH
jgi:hypothetical protein